MLIATGWSAWGSVLDPPSTASIETPHGDQR